MAKVSHNRTIIKPVLLILVILLLAGAVLFRLEKSRKTDLVKMPGNNTQTKQQKDQETKDNANTKREYLDNSYNESRETQPGANVSSQSISLIANQEGSSVVILTRIQGVSSGNCKLVIANGSAHTSQSAKVIYQPEFSSCAGFSLPVSSVGVGSWDITLSVNDSPSLIKQMSLEVR